MKNKIYKKGFNMALPFIAGLALGSVAVIAYNNKNKIKEVLSNSIEKSKDVVNDIKEYAEEKVCKKNEEAVETKEEVKKTTTRKPRTSTKKSTTKIKAEKTDVEKKDN